MLLHLKIYVYCDRLSHLQTNVAFCQVMWLFVSAFLYENKKKASNVRSFDLNRIGSCRICGELVQMSLIGMSHFNFFRYSNFLLVASRNAIMSTVR